MKMSAFVTLSESDTYMKIFINLLPPNKKRDLQRGMVLAYAQTMVTILFIIAILVSGTLISLRIVLQGEYSHLQKQAESAASAESTDIMTNISQINSYLLTTSALQESFIPWTEVLKDLATMIPEQTKLYRFRANEANQIFINGMASTRDESLSLLESLKERSYLSDVKSPLSNILQKTDVKFNFEMRYTAENDG